MRRNVRSPHKILGCVWIALQLGAMADAQSAQFWLQENLTPCERLEAMAMQFATASIPANPRFKLSETAITQLRQELKSELFEIFKPQFGPGYAECTQLPTRSAYLPWATSFGYRIEKVSLRLAQLDAAGGYETTVKTSVTQRAPAGWEGYTITDRMVREGNTPDTFGNRFDTRTVQGAEVMKCPGPDGLVPGKGRFEITSTIVRVEDFGTITQRISLRGEGTYSGNTDDNGWVPRVDLEADLYNEHDWLFTSRSGETFHEESNNSSHARVSFAVSKNTMLPADIGPATFSNVVGLGGSSDAFAFLMFRGATAYAFAVDGWNKPNACVEIEFTPPTETIRLGSRQQTVVLAQVKTLKEHTAVPGRAEIRVDSGAALTPLESALTAEQPLQLNFTSPDPMPAKAGFVMKARTRAGAAHLEWAALRGYELRTITQRVAGDTWQWRHCGKGVGVWIGKSVGINQGEGRGEVDASGSGRFTFNWTNLGKIPVAIEETGTFRWFPGSTPAHMPETLDTHIASVRGFWHPPKPFKRIPVNPQEPPSPQGRFNVKVQLLENPCDPKNP